MTPPDDESGRGPADGEDSIADRQKPEGGASTATVCDLCGAPMIDRHCKLTCPVCGYQRDCSDP
jgi:uncharacterized Zn finger protein (UPF0148 family)